MNNQQGPVMFVECGADLNRSKIPFTRKTFLWPDQTNLYRDHHNNIGVYQTIMNYVNPIWIQNERGQWIINAADSLKYGDFYLDFDKVIERDEDYQAIKADVRKAIRYLTIILSIDLDQIRIFFSGNKGIHVTVSAQTLGLVPHIKLNQVYRDIAKDISKHCKYNTLDTSVYDDKRMFRMTNSLNKKSGLFKVPLTHKEFDALSYNDTKALALKPRAIDEPPVLVSGKAKKAFEKYMDEWTARETKAREYRGKIKQLKKLPPCIEAMHEKLFKETVDERNNSGTALASFYFQQGLEREDTMSRLIAWGENNCSPKLSRRDMEIIVNSVYNGQYRYGCESFKKLSGVCVKDQCPIFNPDLNNDEEETE